MKIVASFTEKLLAGLWLPLTAAALIASGNWVLWVSDSVADTAHHLLSYEALEQDVKEIVVSTHKTAVDLEIIKVTLQERDKDIEEMKMLILSNLPATASIGK